MVVDVTIKHSLSPDKDKTTTPDTTTTTTATTSVVVVVVVVGMGGVDLARIHRLH